MTSHNPIHETSSHQPHENWPDQRANMPPVLKIFDPTGPATWLIFAIDPDDDDTMFGLADLGFQCPELGYISLSELNDIRVSIKIRNPRNGAVISGPPIPLERDLHFQPNGSLSEYARAARHHSQIVDDVHKPVPVKG